MGMNRDLKEQLQEVFEPPEPTGKKRFLEEIAGRYPYPQISHRQFLWIQAAYIRGWVWMLSACSFLAAFVYGRMMDRNVLWVLSAMTPLLAMSALTENMRSRIYGMTELEMASRFSLKSIVMAKMTILGGVHFFLVCLISLLGYHGAGISVLRTGIYLLVPYLLTSAVGLWISRRIHGREALYAVLGAAVSISVFPLLETRLTVLLYRADRFYWWLAALVVLSAIVMTEWRKNIAGTEELT